MDAAPNAKKRRLELDFEREQAKLEEQSKLEDIRQQSQQIEYQRQLEDSRLWPDFELSFGALIHNTQMPEDMKLLALRDNLEPDVRRRVAILFVASANYQTSWKALTERYGNLQAIMHAHVQELLSLQPFSSGDLKSLVNMAALVKDAVTSVNPEE
ncbi:hypothetical protein DAPPUDRAFT_271033, partial [Daphnia pulex]